MAKNKKRLVMIGPVYPYKGGISHHTGSMVKNLKKDFDVKTVSYKMQYPKLLFKKEQRDYANDVLKIDDAQFLINTANPFNIISSAMKIKKMKPDFMIIQWWHPYFSPCYILLSAMLRKIPKIFVCHNVFPHERFPLDKFLTKQVLKRGAGFITHSRMDADDLKSILSRPNYETTVIPTFNMFKIKDMSREEARKILGIPEDRKIMLFFGFVREYKGLKHIIKAMPDIIAADKDIQLMVVGEFGSDKADYMNLIEKSRVGDSITVVDGYIPDKEIEKYFAACDLVVLPYESATQSGIVQIAYSFEKPVIATDVGGLPEVVLDGKTGYIVPPKNPQALGEAVVKFFRENKAAEFSDNVHAEAYRYSWDRMNEVVKRLSEKADRK
ncbi:MAG: glycosyltransferase family 4 protein [Ruminococcus sp.]|nr:glycosyltransferase family 4 protein [Ruminococcus sp.]